MPYLLDGSKSLGGGGQRWRRRRSVGGGEVAARRGASRRVAALSLMIRRLQRMDSTTPALSAARKQAQNDDCAGLAHQKRLQHQDKPAAQASAKLHWRLHSRAAGGPLVSEQLEQLSACSCRSSPCPCSVCQQQKAQQNVHPIERPSCRRRRRRRRHNRRAPACDAGPLPSTFFDSARHQQASLSHMQGPQALPRWLDPPGRGGEQAGALGAGSLLLCSAFPRPPRTPQPSPLPF